MFGSIENAKYNDNAPVIVLIYINFRLHGSMFHVSLPQGNTTWCLIHAPMEHKSIINAK